MKAQRNLLGTLALSLFTVSFSFTNLEEGTTYVVEVIAVLTSGAQTDISDFEFTTNGKSRELVDSSVQCGFESLERTSSSSCDFEGG